jgi:hypothetical protein
MPSWPGRSRATFFAIGTKARQAAFAEDRAEGVGMRNAVQKASDAAEAPRKRAMVASRRRPVRRETNVHSVMPHADLTTAAPLSGDPCGIP